MATPRVGHNLVTVVPNPELDANRESRVEVGF